MWGVSGRCEEMWEPHTNYQSYHQYCCTNSELKQNDASLTDRHLHTDRCTAASRVNKVGVAASCNFTRDTANFRELLTNSCKCRIKEIIGAQNFDFALQVSPTCSFGPTFCTSGWPFCNKKILQQFFNSPKLWGRINCHPAPKPRPHCIYTVQWAQEWNTETLW